MSPSNSSSHGRLVVDRWSIHQDHLDVDNFLAISIMVQRFWDNERGQWLKENNVETTLTSQHQFAKGRVQFELTAHMQLEQITEYLLRWGGDAEGGAPFVEADPRDPSHIVGFDVEIAGLIAEGLGRRPAFVQITFTSIDESIKRGDAEIAPDHADLSVFCDTANPAEF